MSTILGENVRLIRPSPPKKCVVYKSERPYARHQARTRTVKEHCGRVAEIVVEARDGFIYSLAKGLHVDVIEAFGLEVDDIKRVGWRLETGITLWR